MEVQGVTVFLIELKNGIDKKKHINAVYIIRQYFITNTLTIFYTPFTTLRYSNIILYFIISHYILERSFAISFEITNN